MLPRKNMRWLKWVKITYNKMKTYQSYSSCSDNARLFPKYLTEKIKKVLLGKIFATIKSSRSVTTDSSMFATHIYSYKGWKERHERSSRDIMA